jgi:hypothetical protein
MDFKEKEKELLHEGKEKFDYVADPENCGKIVRKDFDGIVIAGFVFIILFLLSAVGGIYYYSRHIKPGQNPASTLSHPDTQPQ